jgi:hypothetical protein
MYLTEKNYLEKFEDFLFEDDVFLKVVLNSKDDFLGNKTHSEVFVYQYNRLYGSYTSEFKNCRDVFIEFKRRVNINLPLDADIDYSCSQIVPIIFIEIEHDGELFVKFNQLF